MLAVINDIRYAEQVIQMIESEVRKFGLVETGGTLVGYMEDNILHVSKASGPGPKAIHEPEYFRADANYIDMFIDMEIANSADKLRYVGEWHTHPQTKPYPSPKDLISLSEIADSSEDFVLMLIAGAIGFDKEKFPGQHIAVVKYKNGKDFYRY